MLCRIDQVDDPAEHPVKCFMLVPCGTEPTGSKRVFVPIRGLGYGMAVNSPHCTTAAAATTVYGIRLQPRNVAESSRAKGLLKDR